MNNIMHEVNGLAVPQRQEDGYVNATKLCKAAGKRLNNWYRLESTKEYLEALSLDTGIPILELVQVRKGGKPEEQGTWIHPKTVNHLQYFLQAKVNTGQQGFIYLFRAKDAVKLGFSTDVTQRLVSLRRWPGELELIIAISGTVDLEKAIHQELHITGDYFGNEWYPLSRQTEICQYLTMGK